MALFSSQNDSWIRQHRQQPDIMRWNETRAERRARKLRERTVARALAARKLLSDQNDDLGDLASAHTRYLQLLARRRAREFGDLASARAQAMSDAASARSGEWLDAASARADVLRKRGTTLSRTRVAAFLRPTPMTGSKIFSLR